MVKEEKGGRLEGKRRGEEREGRRRKKRREEDRVGRWSTGPEGVDGIEEEKGKKREGNKEMWWKMIEEKEVDE